MVTASQTPDANTRPPRGRAAVGFEIQRNRTAEKYMTAAVTTRTAQKSIDLLLVVIQPLQQSYDVRRNALDIA